MYPFHSWFAYLAAFLQALRPELLQANLAQQQQQQMNSQSGASTSRNAAQVTAVDTASQNECFTIWEPLQLRQEWTVRMGTSKSV